MKSQRKNCQLQACVLKAGCKRDSKQFPTISVSGRASRGLDLVTRPSYMAQERAGKNLKTHQQTHRKWLQKGPRGALGERSWNLPRGIGKKTSILTRFWRLLGPSGASWETLVRAIFALGPLPGRSQGARGAIFHPSLVSPTLDPQFGLKKYQKIAFFEGARTLKIELAPRRQSIFHMFTSFLSEP